MIMPGFSTDGILLRRIEYGDHDLIITYFTRSMGRISVVAKNAKKSVKRFAGALDPFSMMNIHCTLPRRKNRLPILASVDLENPFARIRMDTAKTGYASYWVELINAWMEQGKEQTAVYDLLCYVLDALNTGVVEKEVLSLLFQIRFMAISGFSPNIASCSSCAVPIDNIPQQQVLFDIQEGGLVCDRCAAKGGSRCNARQGILVSKGTLKQLAWINSKEIRKAGTITFPAFAVKEGERLLESFVPCHIGREMKSLVFLQRIRR